MYDINKFLDDLDALEYPAGLEKREDSKNFKIKQLNEFGKPFKTHIADIELYPECINHYEAIIKIVEAGKLRNLPYAMILHNMDLLDEESPDDERIKHSYDGKHKKPHIHCVIKFNSQRYNTGVAKWLGIASNYVHMYADSCYKERIAYLQHCDNYDKYLYPREKIVGTLQPLINDLINEYSVPPLEQFENVCIWIKRQVNCNITKTQLQNFLMNCGYSALLRSVYYRLLCERIQDHNNYILLKEKKL